MRKKYGGLFPPPTTAPKVGKVVIDRRSMPVFSGIRRFSSGFHMIEHVHNTATRHANPRYSPAAVYGLRNLSSDSICRCLSLPQAFLRAGRLKQGADCSANNEYTANGCQSLCLQLDTHVYHVRRPAGAQLSSSWISPERANRVSMDSEPALLVSWWLDTSYTLEEGYTYIV
ncbi:hypothetical protein GGX14DRAFT_392116 [Mycena pura]|uniref:Uncharacterized protein n=1 Tax=Mycena pura TaxID=153505 RepID=A0AAD6VJD5_9AGAR|nr:hypothetical protein GGX14DRAFT_392116 [Mycena pura]